MKKTILSIAAALAILASGSMAPAVHAADKGKMDSGYTTPRMGTDMNRDRDMSRDRTEMNKDWFEAHQTSKLTGTEVRNKEGEDLGKIKDFVIDSRGRVQYALLSEGGVMGVGSKTYAVPFEALSYNPKDAKDHYFTLNMSKDQLAKAPVFDEEHFTDRTWTDRVYRFFGVQSRWSDEGMHMDKGRMSHDKGMESGSQYGTQPGTSQTK